MLPPTIAFDADAPSDDAGAYRSLGGTILAAEQGQRLDAFLAQKYPFLSRASWQDRIERGWLLVSGRRVHVAYRVKENESLQFFHPQQVEPEVERDEVYPIWKQGLVMAVHKPGDMPMHENGAYRYNTLAHILREDFGNEWAAVHRLDKETSGLVLCGGSYEMRQALARGLAERNVEKVYRAICRGRPLEQEWEANGPIGDLTASAIRIKKWVVADGLPSQTFFRVLEQQGDYCLLEARPKTGRTHQIRIHAAHAGLPLVGDKLYHDDENAFLTYFMQGTTAAVIKMTGHKRALLHAASISFIHPENGQHTRVHCPMPDDMKLAWDRIKLGLSPYDIPVDVDQG